MDVRELVLRYIQALAWPSVAVFFLITYRKVIESLIPQAKVKLTLVGVPIEITVQELARAVEEPFPGGSLTEEHWDWLKRLKKGRQAFDYDNDNKLLRPLRNAGLIRPYPNGYLTIAREVEITKIGELVLEAWENR
jgi:hypothetical protein